MQSNTPPSSIHLHKKSGFLEVAWNDDDAIKITCNDLRKFCACSRCRARNVVGSLLINESTDITAINSMGSTGIQIVFADGHDKGIYPWHYLRAISDGTAMDCIRG